MNPLPVRLLELLAEGGLRSTAELARCLGITEPVVAMMTEDLTRRGYLASLDRSCSSGCSSCSLVTACHVTATRDPAVLALTEKGRRLAESGRSERRKTGSGDL